MSTTAVDRIVSALLYEGYILYPYRTSAIKNRCRFNFGVVYPRAYAEAQTGSDTWRTRTEIVLLGDEKTRIEVKVRFLRLVDRTVGCLAEPLDEWPAGGVPAIEATPFLEIDGRRYESWQEAAEQSLVVCGCPVQDLLAAPLPFEINLIGNRAFEGIKDSSGQFRAAFLRTQQPVAGSIEVGIHPVTDGVYRLSVVVSNTTPVAADTTRDHALAASLLSAHTILSASGGEFVSLLEPPEHLQEAVASCRNEANFPVLVGEPGQRDTVLSSPIILYDYPQIAPESPGDLFDGCEIDEILSLRILTLTDAEKAAMRSADDHASRLLKRVEALSAESFQKLHGTLRGGEE